MPITSRRKGPYSKSAAQARLNFASRCLKAAWRAMPALAMEAYLIRLLIAERRCLRVRRRGRPEAPSHRWLYPRLRRRRIDVAARLLAIGGRVSPLLLQPVLPAGRSWPGVAQLVGRRAMAAEALNIARWKSAWRALGAAPNDTLHAELLARYAEPHRAYHTQQHLAECLALLDEVRGLAERPSEIEIALWFHDAVYDVHRHDNEAVSASWASTALLDAGAPVDVAERVAALVLATRHSVAPATPDEQLLVDIDLAILGAASARFAEYEAQIRREYAFVPRPVFDDKRGAILAGFLARPALYATAALRDRFEAAARRNLAAAIDSRRGS